MFIPALHLVKNHIAIYVNSSTALHHLPHQSHMLIAALHFTIYHNKATFSFQHCTSSNTTSTTKATCGLSDVRYADMVFV